MAGDAAPRWSEPPAEPVLEPAAVHVWLVRLDDHLSLVDRSRRLLSAAERDRADRFRFPVHRARYALRRGILRTLAGAYLGRAPEAIVFQENARGKPEIVPSRGGGGLRFNVSESAGVALLAFSRDRALGVDVEQIQERTAEERIPERFFAPAEVAALRALPRPAQREAFFLLWTRKEAYIKARGEGLSAGLDTFEVSLAPDHPALLRTRDDPDETRRWTFLPLPPLPGHATALVVEAPPAPLHCFTWHPIPGIGVRHKPPE